VSPFASASVPPLGYSGYSCRLCRKAGESGTEPAVPKNLPPAVFPVQVPGYGNQGSGKTHLEAQCFTRRPSRMVRSRMRAG